MLRVCELRARGWHSPEKATRVCPAVKTPFSLSGSSSDPPLHYAPVLKTPVLLPFQLVQKGYTTFDGVDFSPESIKVSETRQIYRRLLCDEVTSRHKINVQDGEWKEETEYQMMVAMASS